MSKYLIKVEETYRADSEKEAEEIIREAKTDYRFTLSKYTSVKREQKAKGEIVDEWYRVTLTKQFTSEKDPEQTVQIIYGDD